MVDLKAQHLSHDDFSFWIGEWIAEWQYIENEEKSWNICRSYHKVFPALDGKFLIETVEDTGEIENSPIQTGFSIRYYNEELDEWVMIQSWPNRKHTGLSSLTGKFNQGVGVMMNEIPTEEGSMMQKYTFSKIATDYFQWDSKMSKDGDKWKQKMITEFYRKSENVGVIHDEYKLFSYLNGQLQEDHVEFDKIKLHKGRWTGKHRFAESETNAEMEVYTLIGGIAQLYHIQTLEYDALYVVNQSKRFDAYNLVMVDTKHPRHRVYQTKDYASFTFEPFDFQIKQGKCDQPDGKVILDIINKTNMELRIIENDELTETFEFQYEGN